MVKRVRLWIREVLLPRFSLIVSFIAIGLALIGMGYQYFGSIIVIAGIMVLLPLSLAFTLGKYKISYDYFKGSVVSFEFPLYRRLLLLGYLPSLTQVEAKVSYKYGDETTQTFPKNGVWKDTMNFLTRVDRPCVKELKVHEDDLTPFVNGIKRPLIGKVTIIVNLFLQGTSNPLATFNVPITFQEGRLTEKGFIPD